MKPIMKPHRLYPPQDPQALGRHYTDHVLGLTEAGLESKGTIAEQLAWRDKRIADLESEVERQTPFALDWRDALAGIADDVGVPVWHSLAADVRPALKARLGALSLVAAEAAAMLTETNHGGLTHARSESMRQALAKAGVEIPARCSECPDHANMRAAPK